MLPLSTSFFNIFRLASSELGTARSWLLLRSRLVNLVKFLKDVSASAVREQDERFSL